MNLSVVRFAWTSLALALGLTGDGWAEKPATRVIEAGAPATKLSPMAYGLMNEEIN